MDQRVIDLYDEYTHAPLARREFLGRLARLTGSAAAAAALLPLLERRAVAAIVAEDDPRLATAAVVFPGATGEVHGYLAHPAGAGRLPGVVVVHENRGLNAHIRDVARRLALEGFVTLAPDGLSPLGGTPADEDAAREMIGRLDAGKTVGDFVAAVAYLKPHAACTGRVGCVGFCWGGGMANQMAVHSRDLGAAVAYYGRQPAAPDVARITAPLLLHYAGLDTRIGAGIPAFEAALKANGKRYEMFVYEGANHAFNNDTSPARYDPAAAKLAWSRTVTFLKRELGA